MLASAATRDTPEFFHSLTYLWAQIRNENLKESQFPKLRAALEVVTQAYATDKSFDDPNQIQNLWTCVLTNLQFSFDVQTITCTDTNLTLRLSIFNPPPKDRFSDVANSILKAMSHQKPKAKSWKMRHTQDLSTTPVNHQLSFTRYR